MVIMMPTHCEKAVMHTVEVFENMYTKITGKTLPIVTEDSGEDTVYIENDAANVLRLAAECYDDNKFIARDVMDIARTVLGRYMNFMLMDIVCCADNDAVRTKDLSDRFIKLLDIMADLLYLHEDYSFMPLLKS